MPSNEGSGAHSLVTPVGQRRSRDIPNERSGPDSLRRDATEIELIRLRAMLLEREREIAQLRERLAQLEAVPAAPVESPHSHDEAKVDKSRYPTLQRVAFAYASDSLPPPSIRDSVPPSQRRSPRRSCALELEFTEDTHFYAGLTQDISQGGVFIATYGLLPVGSRLDLSFDLPDGTEIRTRGEVRWLRESACSGTRPGMGVAFTELSDEAIVAIHRFCCERPPLYMDI